MPTHYSCRNDERRAAILDPRTNPQDELHPVPINGIDYLTVLDSEAPAESPRQQTLLIVFLLPLVPDVSVENIRIEGGARITPVRPVWAHKAALIPEELLLDSEVPYFSGLQDSDRILVVRTDRAGDFSTYRLSIHETGDSDKPPPYFDILLSEVDFSFRVECPSPFDCRRVPSCPPPAADAPQIDYLAKDYDSFRRQMLERMQVLLPDFQSHPADFTTALVELLAYTGDQLSYYQDAVATEAYLGTARQRTSIRRHTRLLDYEMGDGCNARTWISFEFDGASSLELAKGTPILIGSKTDETVVIDPVTHETSTIDDRCVFETMHSITLRPSHSTITFCTWTDAPCCLPKGATRATLLDDPAGSLKLNIGDFLLFEEVKSPVDGLEENADPDHRHVVRITGLSPGVDLLLGLAFIDVEWDVADAMPFPLCLSSRLSTGETVDAVSVARGNIAVADHGRTVRNQQLEPAAASETERFRPSMSHSPLTFASPLDLKSKRLSAREVMEREQSLPVAQIGLTDPESTEWTPTHDFLEADQYDALFVVETEDDGTSYLRFGDGVEGKLPKAGAEFVATYRIGSGASGNVGRDTLRDIAGSFSGLTLRVRNPLSASGGTDPQPKENAVLYAPEAFRVQERAVTENDYALIAERDPVIQKAAASFRWTGSWHTVYTTVDLHGGAEITAEFRRELLDRLNGYRMAGHDLELKAPRYLPLDIGVRICVKRGYTRSQILRSLLAVFHNGVDAFGRFGFFHPDRFTFGQPLYLSRIYEAIAGIAGIDSASVFKFQLWGRLVNDELKNGMITPGDDQILRLDNDKNFPENGRMEFEPVGGL